MTKLEKQTARSLLIDKNMFVNKADTFLLYCLLILGLINSGRSEESEVPNVCNTGKKQSPIDISMKNVIQKHYDKEDLFKLLNYNERSNPLTIHRIDKQHVMLNGSWDGRKPAISGTVLSNQVYVFSEAHIHWSHDYSGTEHSFEGKRFAAELHIVHVDSKYANVSEALNYPDGLAVVAIPFKVDNKAQHNSGIHQLATLYQSPNSRRTKKDRLAFPPSYPNQFHRFFTTTDR